MYVDVCMTTDPPDVINDTGWTWKTCDKNLEGDFRGFTSSHDLKVIAHPMLAVHCQYPRLKCWMSVGEFATGVSFLCLAFFISFIFRWNMDLWKARETAKQ